MSKCVYCGKHSPKRQVGFTATCLECEQKIVDVQMPYVNEIEEYRTAIAKHERKIEELYETQMRIMNEKAVQMMQEKDEHA